MLRDVGFSGFQPEPLLVGRRAVSEALGLLEMLGSEPSRMIDKEHAELSVRGQDALGREKEASCELMLLLLHLQSNRLCVVDLVLFTQCSIPGLAGDQTHACARGRHLLWGRIDNKQVHACL